MTDILIIERLRSVLQQHHDWHLAQTEPIIIPTGDGGVEIIPANEYCDSTMFEDTTKALHMAEQEIARRTGKEN